MAEYLPLSENRKYSGIVSDPVGGEALLLIQPPLPDLVAARLGTVLSCVVDVTRIDVGTIVRLADRGEALDVFAMATQLAAEQWENTGAGLDALARRLLGQPGATEI